MEKYLLLGDEAIAQGAIDAGLDAVYAYPGTPSTEITEFIQSYVKKSGKGIVAQWCANEKTALETALGVSYAGKRAMCCMKHVGLNVAADCFMNAAISGIQGGLLVVVADDPSMHSSQNEQDSRFYGKFAMIPMLEPADQQEAYDMVHDGFGLSESTGYPVLFRMTTRMAHSRANVTRRELTERKVLPCVGKDGRDKFVLLPAIARRQYRKLIDYQQNFTELSEKSFYNQYFEAPNQQLGIITTGIAFNYLLENFPNGFENPVLKICQYPLPVKLVQKIADDCEQLLILEEGAPLVEELVKGFKQQKNVHGRLDGTLPRDGELTPNLVAKSLGINRQATYTTPAFVVPRPPLLCQGCGHRDVYEALTEVLKEFENCRVFGDIGCYALGALSPFRAIDTCIDMGASITMAKGAAEAGVYPAVAIIGDSTFTHSGMTGLLDCVNTNANVTIIISDNETTAMTGGQGSPGTGRIESICKGIGVDINHLHVVIPLKKHQEEIKQIFRNELNYKGLSVIIPRRECVQTLTRKKKL